MAHTLAFEEDYLHSAYSQSYSRALKQCRLGIKQGGMGLTSAVMVAPAHLDSCHIRYRTSPTISYVQTYDIVRPVLDVVCYIVYTISYIRYSVSGHTILIIRYRMFIRYRMSTYDIVGQMYDIVLHHENISYTISYV